MADSPYLRSKRGEHAKATNDKEEARKVYEELIKPGSIDEGNPSLIAMMKSLHNYLAQLPPPPPPQQQAPPLPLLLPDLGLINQLLQLTPEQISETTPLIRLQAFEFVNTLMQSYHNGAHL